LVVRSKIFIDHSILEKAEKLEFIGRAGAGIDNIDEQAAKERNVQIFNAPEGNRDAVGEHALGMLLMLFNNLYQGHGQVIQGQWEREANRGIELGGKTVGVFGYGNTGRSFAKKINGFDLEVLAYDINNSIFGDSLVEQVNLKTFQEKSDVVSIHVPLTGETEGMVNRNFLQSFKKSIYLINTSRGKVLSLADLLWSIEQGIVLGACLDVLENEKLSTYSNKEKEILNKLIDTNKVLFSPHVAGWTVESYRKISEVLSQKILKYYLATTKLG